MKAKSERNIFITLLFTGLVLVVMSPVLWFLWVWGPISMAELGGCGVPAHHEIRKWQHIKSVHRKDWQKCPQPVKSCMARRSYADSAYWAMGCIYPD